ncbi:hypothetical protein [Sphingomonas bacterium]|uniref:hypothetical protein n=1 Tax=Sphingomonas bacterium TaxID=1895847 RepID=UPI0015762636|nr:hypothetical protein [Sphingomonas bacterium]
MRSTLSLALAVAGAGVLSGSAEAASTFFGGTFDLRAGYGRNPQLRTGLSGDSPVFGGRLDAVLTRLTGKGRTTLSGTADITQSTKIYGRTENYLVQLSQQQQISARIAGSADVSYSDTTNPAANYGTTARDLVPIGDVLTLGQHSRQLAGDVNASWQMDAKDLFQGAVNASHTSFDSVVASSYTQYGGSFGYLRTINARTRIGFQLSGLKIRSDSYPGSSSFQGGLQLTQKLSQAWTFQGGVSGVLQKANGGSFKTIGFNGSLCGDYPRYTICVIGSRQSAPSGIGGLRNDTQGSVRINYKLSARSQINGEITYDISNAKGIALATQRYYDAALSYRRTIRPRISAGFSARYQRRDIGAIGVIPGTKVNGYTGTADISYQFGRTS